MEVEVKAFELKELWRRYNERGFKRPGEARGRLLAAGQVRGRVPSDEELAERLGMSEDELQEALLQISNSPILALEELWMTPDASGDKVSLLDTIEDESAPDPQAALAAQGLRRLILT